MSVRNFWIFLVIMFVISTFIGWHLDYGQFGIFSLGYLYGGAVGTIAAFMVNKR